MTVLSWSPDDMTDMHGKIAIVTGANSGLGMEITRRLCEHHAHVVMVVRNRENGLRAMEQLTSELPYAKLDMMICDLASLRSIEHFVADFSRRMLPLHLLVNNAGVFLPAPALTEDGFDLSLGVNYYGTLYLTHLLLPLLQRSAPSRIVFMASRAEAVGWIRWGDLRGAKFSAAERGLHAYATSKLMLVMYAMQLAARLEGTGVDAFVAHPGMSNTPASTKVDRHSHPLLGALSLFMARAIAQTPSWGARSMLYAATTPELQGRSGKMGSWCLWSPSLELWGPGVAAHPVLSPQAWRASERIRLVRDTHEIINETVGRNRRMDELTLGVRSNVYSRKGQGVVTATLAAVITW